MLRKLGKEKLELKVLLYTLAIYLLLTVRYVLRESEVSAYFALFKKICPLTHLVPCKMLKFSMRGEGVISQFVKKT